MQIRHLFGVFGEQACVEHVGEQVVVAVPGALGVERADEEVLPLEVGQRPGTVGAAGDGVAQRAVKAVEDRGPEQEVTNLWGLPGQNFVGQVVDDEPVATGERRNEASDLIAVGDAAQGEGGELEAGDPALRTVLQRFHVGGGELQPHDPVEELPRLSWGEAEFGGAQLTELRATAQPGQRQRRIGAGRYDQVQMIR